MAKTSTKKKLAEEINGGTATGNHAISNAGTMDVFSNSGNNMRPTNGSQNSAVSDTRPTGSSNLLNAGTMDVF